jgi:uncharacterized protein (TIGR01777 family)
MKMIVSGGTGLIGSELIHSLVQDKHEIILLSRSPERHSGRFAAGVRVVKWDGYSSRGWGDLMEGADVVVNLAGESIGGDSLLTLMTKRWTGEQKKRILDSRLNSGKALVQAIAAAREKPRLMIQASAVGYYGDRGDEPLPESAAPGSDFLANVCMQWEGSTAEVEELGLRRVIIRTGGVVMSTSGGSLPFMLIPYRFFMGGPLGNGKQWLSWIHIKDEIRAIRFLIDYTSASGPFNLAAPQNIRNADFSRVIGKVIRRPAFISIPAIFFKIILGEKSKIILDSQRQIPERLPALGFQFRYPQVEMALRDLLNVQGRFGRMR